MKVLSLFDGMACLALALQKADIPIDSYDAYEIDKYAIETACHNFPFIKQHGDVFKADFTQYKGVDIIGGGSPCTYWSIAKKEGRETTASGIGWELFQQYVRAIKEAQPRYFVYENNKSMSNAIRDSISESFGFEPILINSALVSAQNRQRLYWIGKRNADGTYSKVEIEQPEDRGILLKDILESGICDREKAYVLKHQAAHTIKAGYAKQGMANFITNGGHDATGVAERIPKYSQESKARPINAYYANNCGGIEHRIFSENPNKQQVDVIAEPVRIGDIGSTADAHRVYSSNGKSRTIKANAGGQGGKTGLYFLPVDSEKAMPIKEATKNGKTMINFGDCFDYTQPNSTTRRGRNMKDKSNCLTTSCGFYQYCGTVMPIYEIKNGIIIHNGKEYPIKLIDGYYIIRKLTVRECMRLQTVPEWYEFPVSDTQAYKMLGNGWTVDVIAHILKGVKESEL